MADPALNPADRYSRIDRALHRLAFSTVGAQKALADIEDRLHARRLAGVAVERPVFVASLPRAGTTLLLEALYGTGAFAAHTYRRMPFLFIPLLWDALSRRLRVTGAPVERAHGDGMTTGFDGVEAFEEALWRAFWPDHYRPDRILPWDADERDPGGEFEEFLRNHLRKIVALHPTPARYLSKNNGNAARVPLLPRLFPDATVLIPFREPVAHAASMLRQHRTFSALHARDGFARRYMRDLGHFEFGANFAPVAFDGWLDAPGVEPPERADMWLRYWNAAFTHLLAQARADARIALVDYDACCADAEAGLARVADAIGLDGAPRERLIAQAARFRPPTAYDDDALGLDEAMLADARALHGELRAAAR